MIYVNEHAKNRIERTYPSIIAPQAARTHREDTGTTGVSGPARYQPQESVGKMRGLEMAKAGSRKARGSREKKTVGKKIPAVMPHGALHLQKLRKQGEPIPERNEEVGDGSVRSATRFDISLNDHFLQHSAR